MENDDVPIGRILSRREALRMFSAAGMTMLAACTSDAGSASGASGGAERGTTSFGNGPAVGAGDAAGVTTMPQCVVRPEMTEGPYFADVRLNRSDVRSEPSTGETLPGVPLSLTFNVSEIGPDGCTPLPGAMVDVWQCDARGRYSAFQDRRIGFDTRDQSFLRGYQLTDDAGRAHFVTIYPGWYPGRAVHIHFKIRKEVEPGRAWQFTSQLFMDEAQTDQVHAGPPYAAGGRRDTRNENDAFYRRGGDQLMLALAPRGDGFNASFGIALDLSRIR